MMAGNDSENTAKPADRACEDKGSHAVGAASCELAIEDVGFPQMLKLIPQAPRRLYLRGDPALLDLPGISIVGARKATPYGLYCAGHFAQLAVACGLSVVSGGAIGCDQAAHRGALDAGGKTVVVLGCGADVVYPKRARLLFEEVLERGGAIVSEFPWGAQPVPWAFRRRNRIIAGLGEKLLVVEAGLPSGTFGTADDALAQGKDVLVVPGSILSPESAGSNRLLQQGAAPVIDDESFLDALALRTLFVTRDFDGAASAQGMPPVERPSVDSGDAVLLRGADMPSDRAHGERRKPPLTIPSIDDALLSALRANPSTIDELLGLGGRDFHRLSLDLMRAESAGVIVRYRDGRYGIAHQYAKLLQNGS